MIDHRARYWFDLSLIRAVRLDRERVDVSLKHLRKDLVHHSMALYPATARKGRCNDLNFKMSLAIPRACVTGMQVALVLDQQVCGGKRNLESLVDSLSTLVAHGKTSLNGLTVTLA
jgi:hypothetical protein